MAILVSHISFRRALKAQGIAAKDLPYTAFGQPWGSYYALTISLLVIVFSGYDAFIPTFHVDKFILKYLGVVIFVANTVIWKWWKGTKRVTASTMDLVTGSREYQDRETASEKEWTEGFWRKMLHKLKK